MFNPDSHNYKRYIELKNQGRFDYKGIDYSRVLAHDLSRIAFTPKSKIGFKEIITGFLLKKDVSKLLSSCHSTANLFTFSVDRPDYHEQMKITTQGIDSVDVLLVESLPEKLNINVFSMLRSLAIAFSRFKGQLTFKQQVFVASKIERFKSFHRSFTAGYQSNGAIKHYIAFNSAYKFEALLSCLFKKYSIPTYSLSHSFYVKFKNFIPLDIINVENINAEKLFVWGRSSIADINQNYSIPEDRLIVGGNPKYPYKQINIKQSFKKCIVLLGRIIYQQENFKIIDIIKAYLKTDPKMQFVLKLHLSLDTEVYQSRCTGTTITIQEGKKSLTELFVSDEYDFAIVNNSTAYYEAMYYDMVCLRYAPGENEQFTGVNDRFEDAETLKAKIKYFKNVETNGLNAQLQHLMTDTLGIGISTYSEVLN